MSGSGFTSNVRSEWDPLPIDEELEVLGNIDLDYDVGSHSGILHTFQYSPDNLPVHIPRSAYNQEGTVRTTSALPTNEGYELDPIGIGNWPRRLLHVPKMISLEWSPGANYRGCGLTFREPKYHAISYTWGRYALKRDSRQWRATPGLYVQNITWEIPKIDSQYFTVENFKEVIRATQHSERGQEVQFVWLDVACINQNNGPEKSLEIGRQAQIFRGATSVVIWLHQQRRQDLANALSVLTRPIIDIANLNFAEFETSLLPLLADKWFSSLWTYQEAYLSQHIAVFAPKSGGVIAGSSLAEFITNCSQISNSIENYRQQLSNSGPRTQDEFLRDQVGWRVHQALHYHGILALATRSPFALYSATFGRSCWKDVDRVYGIQQVFPVRVGATVSGSNPDRFYSKATLEAQLGRALVQDFPVESQMFVFEEEVEDGWGWHISPSSHIPYFVQGSHQRRIFAPCCNLTVLDDVNAGVTYVKYNGYQQNFVHFKDWCHSQDAHWLDRPGEDRPSVQKIALDVQKSHQRPGERPEYRTWGRRRDIRSGREQHMLAEWLASSFIQERLTVLALGSFVEDQCRYLCGLLLILASDGGGYQKRIGIVVWRDDELRNVADQPGWSAGWNCFN